MLESLTFHVVGTTHETYQPGAEQDARDHAVGVSAEEMHRWSQSHMIPAATESAFIQ